MKELEKLENRMKNPDWSKTAADAPSGVPLKPGERVDELQRNGYRIIQDPGRFRFGMDAVLLSGFTRVKEGERVLDLGTGTGSFPSCWRQRRAPGI